MNGRASCVVDGRELDTHRFVVHDEGCAKAKGLKVPISTVVDVAAIDVVNPKCRSIRRQFCRIAEIRVIFLGRAGLGVGVAVIALEITPHVKC